MTNKIKIFVDCPSFSKFSNGTKCIHELINYLEFRKFQVIKLHRDERIITKIKMNLSIKSEKKLNYIFKDFDYKKDWFLSCDTTPLFLMNYVRRKHIRIISWQLAPYKFLGAKNLPFPGEYNMPFSSFCDPYSKDFYYYQPSIDKEWINALEKCKKIRKSRYRTICIYTGKGKLKEIPKSIKNIFCNRKIKLITRLSPSSRRTYFNYLRNCDGLISFDEMTQTNLEAASLGIPVYIANKCFPKNSIREFPIHDIKNRITVDPNKFLSMISSKSLRPYTVKYLEKYNSNTFKKIERIFKSKIKTPKITFLKFKQIKEYAKYLEEKKSMLPLINGGQSPGTIFLNLYIRNINNEKRFKLVCKLIKFTDFIGSIFWKLKIIRIIERIIIMIFVEKIFLMPLRILLAIKRKVKRYLGLISNFILFRK